MDARFVAYQLMHKLLVVPRCHEKIVDMLALGTLVPRFDVRNQTGRVDSGSVATSTSVAVENPASSRELRASCTHESHLSQPYERRSQRVYNIVGERDDGGGGGRAPGYSSIEMDRGRKKKALVVAQLSVKNQCV
ncbi:hypothetical protein PsorP6_003247 [Peronosclerospora sorghi]|uniref:Uncharacterized protein n=1 Tax=Peronosclerospora sorghi TaxID=230839 RepID=A0ACC0VSD0_9STRA|nr:hypothetical protein PsorP6_003247 [Peronosclerospora sorghi]